MPPCPSGHSGKVVLAGTRRLRQGLLSRPRYWCYPRGKKGLGTGPDKDHRFTATRQHKTTDHPTGESCHECEARPTRFQGPLVAWDWDYAAREIAELLMNVGRGLSYRASAAHLRLTAGRVRRDPGGLPIISSEGKTAQQYLDVFGEEVVAAFAHESWPRVLLLDVIPIRSNLTDEHGRPMKGGETKGAFLVAAGYTEPVPQRIRPLRPKGNEPPRWRWEGPKREPHLWAVKAAGTADAASWWDFLNSLTGEPEWIVIDGDQAVRNAIADLWGNRPMVYSCEGHLMNRLVKRAVKEDKMAPVDALGLLGDAFSNEATWWAFVERVAALPPSDSVAVRSWLGIHHGIVVNQMRRRRRGFPRGIGALESYIVRLGDWIGERRKVIQNVRRINIMLGLMRNQLAHHAEAAIYTEIVRRTVIAKSRPYDHVPPTIDWRQHHDRNGRRGLFELVDDAVNRGAAYDSLAQRDSLHRSMINKIAAVDAYRQSLGLSPLRVSGNNPPQPQVGGDKLSDHPQVAREWDYERNGDLRPDDVGAGSSRRVHWVCANDPEHRWKTLISQRTKNLTGCPTCARRGQWPQPPSPDEILDSAPPAFIRAPKYDAFSADDELNRVDRDIELPPPVDAVSLDPRGSDTEAIWNALLAEPGGSA